MYIYIYIGLYVLNTWPGISHRNTNRVYTLHMTRIRTSQRLMCSQNRLNRNTRRVVFSSLRVFPTKEEVTPSV